MTIARAADDLEFDHVIVGGGTAGCVLANRLSEEPDVHVLLLEAGSRVCDGDVANPQAWPTLIGGRYDWKYRSVRQRGLDGRVLAQPRGRGLGGSTLINALGFQRGSGEAYDAWARHTGDTALSAEAMRHWFRKLETCSAGEDAWRGGSGPLHVRVLGADDVLHPIAAASHAAAIACGFEANPDWNAARADGAVLAQYAMRDGRRHDAATAYLDPVRDRPNLHIRAATTVQRLVLSGTRCIGVQVGRGPDATILRARRDVILCAGAIDSPRLLLLSGIGPADALRLRGIAPIVDLAGVGMNLADHPLVPGLVFRSDRAVPISRFNHCETMAVGRTSHSAGGADMQIMTLDVPFIAPELGPAPAQCFSMVPCLMSPRSRGRVTLDDADPEGPALIDPAYLAEESDVAALEEVVEIARDLAHAPALRDWNAGEVFPGPGVRTRAKRRAYLRRVVSAFFHPAGTCAMGREEDPDAVVTPDFAVRGTEGLRVVDASVFPNLPQAMTMAAVFAIAERAADVVRKLHA